MRPRVALFVKALERGVSMRWVDTSQGLSIS